jgi:hypothetical protein
MSEFLRKISDVEATAPREVVAVLAELPRVVVLRLLAANDGVDPSTMVDRLGRRYVIARNEDDLRAYEVTSVLILGTPDPGLLESALQRIRGKAAAPEAPQ